MLLDLPLAVFLCILFPFSTLFVFSLHSYSFILLSLHPYSIFISPSISPLPPSSFSITLYPSFIPLSLHPYTSSTSFSILPSFIPLYLLLHHSLSPSLLLHISLSLPPSLLPSLLLLHLFLSILPHHSSLSLFLSESAVEGAPCPPSPLLQEYKETAVFLLSSRRPLTSSSSSSRALSSSSSSGVGGCEDESTSSESKSRWVGRRTDTLLGYLITSPWDVFTRTHCWATPLRLHGMSLH